MGASGVRSNTSFFLSDVVGLPGWGSPNTSLSDDHVVDCGSVGDALVLATYEGFMTMVAGVFCPTWVGDWIVAWGCVVIVVGGGGLVEVVVLVVVVVVVVVGSAKH